MVRSILIINTQPNTSHSTHGTPLESYNFFYVRLTLSDIARVDLLRHAIYFLEDCNWYRNDRIEKVENDIILLLATLSILKGAPGSKDGGSRTCEVQGHCSVLEKGTFAKRSMMSFERTFYEKSSQERRLTVVYHIVSESQSHTRPCVLMGNVLEIASSRTSNVSEEPIKYDSEQRKNI